MDGNRATGPVSYRYICSVYYRATSQSPSDYLLTFPFP